MIRWITPPLPAASLPSKTITIFAPFALTHSCICTSRVCSLRSSFSYCLFLSLFLPSCCCLFCFASLFTEISSSEAVWPDAAVVWSLPCLSRNWHFWQPQGSFALSHWLLL